MTAPTESTEKVEGIALVISPESAAVVVSALLIARGVLCSPRENVIESIPAQSDKDSLDIGAAIIKRSGGFKLVRDESGGEYASFAKVISDLGVVLLEYVHSSRPQWFDGTKDEGDLLEALNAMKSEEVN